MSDDHKIEIPSGYVRLRITKPSPNVERWYQDKLLSLVDGMCRSVNYWAAAAYKPVEKHIGVTDAAPDKAFSKLSDQMAELTKRWSKRFEDESFDLAKMFSQKSVGHVDSSFEKMMKAVGFGIKFYATDRQRLFLKATIKENVGLIKSIPEKYMSDVAGQVYRSVSSGGDIKSLTDYLQDRHDITRRRAVLIASDQNSKAASNLTKIRQEEVGIEEAVWKHSGAGHHPRPSHQAFSGNVYNVKKGAYIDGEYVQPGELIHCRCISIPIISRRHLRRLKDRGIIKESPA